MKLLSTYLLLALAAVLAWFPVDACGQTSELRQRWALGGRVSLAVPAEFQPMPEDLRKVKYPSETAPAVVFTNVAGSINVALSHTNTSVAPERVPDLAREVERTLQSLPATLRWNRTQIVIREGRPYFIFDFWSQAADTEIRNIMVGTSLEGRLLLVSCNVVKALEKQWAAVGERVISSVLVHER